MSRRLKNIAVVSLLVFSMVFGGSFTAKVYAATRAEGYDDGYKSGFGDGQRDSYENALEHLFDMGDYIWGNDYVDYVDGFVSGYSEGYEAGKNAPLSFGQDKYITDKPSQNWDYDDWKKYLDQWEDYVADARSKHFDFEISDAEFAQIEKGRDDAYAAYEKWHDSLSIDDQWNIYTTQSEKVEEELQWQGDLARAAEKAAAERAAAHAAKPITLQVNGKTVQTDSPPVVENGRTLAPLRATVEALGHYIVGWDSTSQTIGIYSYETEVLLIEMRIGSNIAKVLVGDQHVYDDRMMDVPAKIINGRTMVPVRFIAETLGLEVNWNEADKIVAIKNKG